jgi:hypothetical protein
MSKHLNKYTRHRSLNKFIEPYAINIFNHLCLRNFDKNYDLYRYIPYSLIIDIKTFMDIQGKSAYENWILSHMFPEIKLGKFYIYKNLYINSYSREISHISNSKYNLILSTDKDKVIPINFRLTEKGYKLWWWLIDNNRIIE